MILEILALGVTLRALGKAAGRARDGEVMTINGVRVITDPKEKPKRGETITSMSRGGVETVSSRPLIGKTTVTKRSVK
jgi:hypothetical protein